jgi:large subunit ribosomal protein L21
MKYAVIQTGGKQYRVSEGDIIEVERLPLVANDSVQFSEVLLVTTDGTASIGQPFISGMTVSGKVIENVKGEKIRISKFKAKARYRRVTGHRQSLSQVQIETIGSKKEQAKVAEPKEEVAKVAKTAKTQKAEK